MKIGILGAGAMGCMIASFLLQGGADVFLVSRNKENMDAIRQNGLSFDLAGTPLLSKPQTYVNPDDAEKCDILIILTKCQDTYTALKKATNLYNDHTYLISLQNGLGNENTLLQFTDKDHVCYGTINAGSVMYEPGKIRLKGSTDTLKEAIFLKCLSSEKPSILHELINAFSAGGITATYSENIDEMIWRKATFNVASSFLFAICQVKGQDVADMPEVMDIQKKSIQEMKDVAFAKGIPFDFEKNWSNYENAMIHALQFGYPSSVSDVFHKKATEIDYMNGFISKEGNRLGIPTPINDTITTIVHILEHTYEYKYSERL